MRAFRRGFSSRSSLLASPQILQCSRLLGVSSAASAGTKGAFDDTEVRLRGFVRSIRKQKRIAFAQISDGSTVKNVQAVFEPGKHALDKITTGSAIDLSGTWASCPPGKEQRNELVVSQVHYLGESDPSTYPIQKKTHTVDFLRQHPHLRLRTSSSSSLSRFRSECLRQLPNAFSVAKDNSTSTSVSESNSVHSCEEFLQVQPPLITSSDCEGAGEVFTVTTPEYIEKKHQISNQTGPEDTAAPQKTDDVDFFRTPKYLTVSSQLHLEAYAAELGNAWTLSPTFRAEKSDTQRHLSEFYMLEAEMNFVPELGKLMEVAERLLCELVRRVHGSRAGRELLQFRQEANGLDLLPSWQPFLKSGGTDWPRISYSEAIRLLQQSNEEFTFAPTWEGGLQFEHEKYIAREVGGSDRSPVFITHYPQEIKPFYMLPSSALPGQSEEVKDTVACFDLIFPDVGEVVGGSLREHRLEKLISAMRQHGLVKRLSHEQQHSTTPYPYLSSEESLHPLQWYADLRRWGSAPHGGFGIGFDRLLGYLSGIESLREVVAFPRYVRRADC